MKTIQTFQFRTSARLTVAALVLANGIASASDIEVRQDGSGQATTIQGGINLAVPGDTVIVYPGVYPERVVVDRDIVVRTRTGHQRAIIDAAGLNGAAVTLTGPLTATTVFEGFAVRHGVGGGVDAGGIVVEFCSPVVRGNLVFDNLGHGLSARGAGTPRFEDNVVVRNSGDGLMSWAARSTVTRNRFLGNSAHGIEFYNELPAEISFNLITRNGLWGISATIPSSSSSTLVQNNTIVRNLGGVRLDYFADRVTLFRNVISTNRTTGIECGSPYGLCPTLDENDVWNNLGSDYSGPVSSPTDISASPVFCAPTQLDYGLHAGSPCNLGPGVWIGAFGPGC